MKQAQASRYKFRIQAVSLGALLLTSVVGVFTFMKNAGSSSVTAIETNGVATSELLMNLLTAGFVVLPFTLLISWALYSLLNVFYMRDPLFMLEEGCYSDTSWLNLQDNQLVLLDQDAILTADFNQDQAQAISKEFENDSSCRDLHYVLCSKQLNRILFSNIQLIKSCKDESFIEIVSDSESIVLQFQNTGTKAHALSYIKARLPTTVPAHEPSPSRLMAALPQLTSCGLFVLGAALFNPGAALAFMLAAPAVFLLPSLLESLLEPNVHEQWSVNEAVAAQQVDEPSTYRQAA